jgi:YbbR domain-containing protein
MSKGKGKSGIRLKGLNLAPLRRVFERSRLIKLFCLLLAFALWQAIRESTSFEMVVADVPVTVLAGDGRAVFHQSAESVNIRFRGSRDDVRFVNRDQVAVSIDASGRTDRLRHTFKFSPRFVKAPPRVHAVQFEPPEVTVTMDREVERILPVRAVLEGELPSGIQLEKTACTPASVKVRGAERLLSELEQVRTVPVSLDGRYNPFKVNAAIAAAHQPWTVSPDRVTVDVLLVERVSTRRIENSRVRPMLASDDMRTVRIRPEQVSITLRGSPQRIAELDERNVYAYIDCSGLAGPAEYEVSVRVDVPDGLQVDEVEPPAVKVTVKTM